MSVDMIHYHRKWLDEHYNRKGRVRSESMTRLEIARIAEAVTMRST
jgi:hypothetical protein